MDGQYGQTEIDVESTNGATVIHVFGFIKADRISWCQFTFNSDDFSFSDYRTMHIHYNKYIKWLCTIPLGTQLQIIFSVCKYCFTNPVRLNDGDLYWYRRVESSHRTWQINSLFVQYISLLNCREEEKKREHSQMIRFIGDDYLGDSKQYYTTNKGEEKMIS